MTWNAPQFTRELKQTADAFDRAVAAARCEELVTHLYGSAEVYPPGEAERVLGILRNKRWFDLMQKVGDAFIQTERATLKVRRQYAQALIDQGNLTAALSVLEVLVRETAGHPGENAEARGLIGRVYKQLYLNAHQPALPRNQQSLQRAARAYLEVYQSDPRNFLWHGINVVALVSRAAKDAVPLPGFPQVEALAADILECIQARHDDKQAATWDYATALEACVALRQPSAAVEWLARYVRADADAFELASTLRQFTEVWRLEADPGLGPNLLPPLRAALLAKEGGQVTLAPGGLASEGKLSPVGAAALEKVLGAESYKTYQWYLTGLQRCRAVARIGRDATRGFGTGFLVKGSDLSPALGDELVLLTNAHVVSDPSSVAGALRPEDAIVSFQAMGPEEHRVATLVWTSPPHELDATVLRLEPGATVDGLDPYPLARHLPLNDGQQRVYVIGHPGGGTLSLSLQDNLLLDHDGRLLHYRAPTEGGSSGSPVFNDTEKWELIGLHHAGSTNLPRLNGKPGTHAANEGITLSEIKTALGKALEGRPGPGRASRSQ